MPAPLKYVGQQAMDLYYQQYKADSVDFFTLEDCTQYCGNFIAAFYQSTYNAEYNRLLQEKKQEVIGFDEGFLDEQILDVTKESGTDLLYAKFKRPVMSFLNDKNMSGIQNVFIVDPRSGIMEIERSPVSQLWQLNYLPKTNRIFYHGGNDRLNFVNKGSCNLQKVRVLTVPAVFDGMLVPDGLITDTIKGVPVMMREVWKNSVIKESLDQNKNKVMETEIDKSNLK